MNVLSLFDWISCWRLALERAWIKVDKYFASEIDKYAIQVSKKNYPDIIHIGSVTDIEYDNDTWFLYNQVDKWNRKAVWEEPINIDIIIWWSPCQSFSIAWKQEWFDGKSWLFYEYLRILKEVKPKYFLLENVKMKKEYQDIISKELWVEPIRINSSLVSPALRDRFYWTNIPWIQQPKNKWIELQSILSSWFTDRKKARALLESDSRPLKDKKRMWHRYKNTWFTTIVYENSVEDIENIRYMNQEELEKCQTLPVWYTSVLDRNRAASVIGNWWTVDVIAHIFSYIK